MSTSTQDSTSSIWSHLPEHESPTNLNKSHSNHPITNSSSDTTPKSPTKALHPSKKRFSCQSRHNYSKRDERDEAKNEKQSTSKGYVNPDRVLSGGNAYHHLQEDDLIKRMERIRIQNEEINRKRLEVEDDIRAFEEVTEREEHLKGEELRRIEKDKSEQEKKERETKLLQEMKEARDANVQRKLQAIKSREWDAHKSIRDK
ncbi:uncharacterized protein VTP21DRAFT_3533 [Calcarisporiella thermophila]|uniref:uncharacterized protein n=1 Tax=Calcarisporiella thermophila TaxID=911321 RepID=UPI003743B76B